MLLDRIGELHEPSVEVHTVRAQYQLVEVLTMASINFQTGADILVHEEIVEYDDVVQTAIPIALVEDCDGLIPIAMEYYMRRIDGGEAAPLSDGERIVRSERAQDGGDRGLAPPVLGVEEGELCEVDVGASIDRIERPYVPEELKFPDHS